MALIVPAVLPASREEFEKGLARCTSISGVRRIQIDVVDGKFVAPASWPCNAPKDLERMLAKNEMLPALDRIEYEMDLMCFDPNRVAREWLALGASRLVFHVETTTDVATLLASARKWHGHDLISFGLSLNNSTDLSFIEPYIADIEFVQFMGIARIGVQGQPFDARVLERIRVFHGRHPEMEIQVDGAVSLESAKKLIALGVSNLIVGSALSRASDPSAQFAAFEALESPYGV